VFPSDSELNVSYLLYPARHGQKWQATVDPARLIDVRQIGPESERDISGRCSACGVFLIARLDKAEKTTPELLRDRLDKLFNRHLTERVCGAVPRRSDPE
jgi:hypothetical protein